MLTKEENERLTRVGPGTPGGELLRRYWWPVAASSQLKQHGTLPVKLLGESLVLYRDRSGQWGLVGDRCPHRNAGIIYAVPEQQGLRCAYHGWLFDRSGRCLEQPYEQTEDPDSTFRDRVRITAYPAEELAGLIFAYLGPEPAPLIPRWDLFAKANEVPHEIGWAVLPCNWLQIVENALDPVHVEWLHQHFTNYVYERLGRPDMQRPRMQHTKIGFDLFEYGIIKRRLLVGDTEEHERWATGHPLVFPMMLKSGSAAHPTFQIRTPIDDEHTLHIWYTSHFKVKGDLEVTPHDEIPFFEVPVPDVDERGLPIWSLVDNNSGQDIAMWVTQGATTDRGAEHLGLSDRGIILYRKLLKENIEKVERGEDPMNVFRDPARNICLDLPVERAKFGQGTYQPGQRRGGGVSKYSPLLRAAEEKALTAVAPLPVVPARER